MYTFSKRVSSLQPSAIREKMKNNKPGAISFAQGNPSSESFPFDELQTISESLFQNNPNDFLQYGLSEGYEPLRQALLNRTKQQGYGKDFDEVIIVSGAQQGIELSCKIFCNEGDSIICENPSFIGSLNSFRSYNVNLLGVDVESDGMNINQLEQQLKDNPNTKLIYTIPNFQNPTGVTMSLEKRKAIYNLAKQYNVLIVEDDPYGEVRFKGKPIPTIKSLDTEGIVIYIGSFSKVISAGLRVGYVLAPLDIVQKMVVTKQCADVHTNLFAQMIVERFMTTYNYDLHLYKLQNLYKLKSELMINCLNNQLIDYISFDEPEGGLFIWCELNDNLNLSDFIKQSSELGVSFIPGSVFSLSPHNQTQSFRLNYSTPSDQQIVEGILRMKKAIARLENNRGVKQ